MAAGQESNTSTERTAPRRRAPSWLAPIGAAFIMTACAGGQPTQATPAASGAKPPVAAPVTDDLNHELVAFIGDSITFYWDDPAWAPEEDLLSSHLPQFIDAGINGQTSAQMLARFGTDILDKHLGTIVINAGTNDVDYLDVNANTNPRDAAATSLGPEDMNSLFAMVEMAVASGADVIVGTLPPQDFAGVTQTQQQLHAQWNEGIRTGAPAYGYTVAEFYDAMVNADGTQNAGLFAADRVHPDGAGYAVMWAVLAPLLNASTHAHQFETTMRSNNRCWPFGRACRLRTTCVFNQRACNLSACARLRGTNGAPIKILSKLLGRSLRIR
jgi:lysophospholipase L1-like esterase